MLKKKGLTYFVIGSAEMLGLNCWCIFSEQDRSIQGMENLSYDLLVPKDARGSCIIKVFFFFFSLVFSRKAFETNIQLE